MRQDGRCRSGQLDPKFEKGEMVGIQRDGSKRVSGKKRGIETEDDGS